MQSRLGRPRTLSPDVRISCFSTADTGSMGGAMQPLFSLLLSYFVIILIVIVWLWSLDIKINVSAADTGSMGGAM